MSAERYYAWQVKSWPDWCDTGRLVEIKYENGSTLVGELWAVDEICTDEDEIPVFAVFKDGEEHSFAECAEWRFVRKQKTT